MPNIEQYKVYEQVFTDSTYDKNISMNITKEGIPLYAALSKSPPTTCTTPGKMIPSGYTKTGKYKASRWTTSKTDKRAGK
jgi:hypothetical protein